MLRVSAAKQSSGHGVPRSPRWLLGGAILQTTPGNVCHALWQYNAAPIASATVKIAGRTRWGMIEVVSRAVRPNLEAADDLRNEKIIGTVGRASAGLARRGRCLPRQRRQDSTQMHANVREKRKWAEDRHEPVKAPRRADRSELLQCGVPSPSALGLALPPDAPKPRDPPAQAGRQALSLHDHPATSNAAAAGATFQAWCWSISRHGGAASGRRPTPRNSAATPRTSVSA